MAQIEDSCLYVTPVLVKIYGALAVASGVKVALGLIRAPKYVAKAVQYPTSLFHASPKLQNVTNKHNKLI